MAYTKTTWMDMITPLNDNNLNKIEQGIEDLDILKSDKTYVDNKLEAFGLPAKVAKNTTQVTLLATESILLSKSIDNTALDNVYTINLDAIYSNTVNSMVLSLFVDDTLLRTYSGNFNGHFNCSVRITELSLGNHVIYLKGTGNGQVFEVSGIDLGVYL